MTKCVTSVNASPFTVQRVFEKICENYMGTMSQAVLDCVKESLAGAWSDHA